MNEVKYRQQLFSDRWNLMQSRSTIGQIYPNVEKIILKLDFVYQGVVMYERHRERVFSQNDKDFFLIDCINPECVQTDLDLSQEIHFMIRKNEPNSSGQKTCNGYQDFERFQAKNIHCLTEMKFEIEIEYKK